jgi:hypothetical protein
MTSLPDSDFDSLLPPLTVSRRGFIAGSLASGFALGAAEDGWKRAMAWFDLHLKMS